MVASRLVGRGRAAWERAQRYGPVERAVSTHRRYHELGMGRTASAATYFAVLTLLPFLSLAYLLVGQLVADNPRFLRGSRVALENSLGLGSDVIAKLYSAEGTASIRATLTLVGVIGLTYAGLAWMDLFRQGLRAVWPHARDAGPRWRRYGREWLTLLATLPVVLMIAVLSVFIDRGPYQLLASSGLPVPRFWQLPLELLALIATVSWAGVVSYGAYRRIGRAVGNRDLKIAALVSGVGLGGLAVIGSFLLSATLSNPYGIVVAILALMLWVSASLRVLLAMAVWASVGAGGQPERSTPSVLQARAASCRLNQTSGSPRSRSPI